MSGSLVPVAIDALVSLARTAVASATPVDDIAPVQVIDGQPGETEPDFVAVAFAGDSGQDAVTDVHDIGDAGMRQTFETFDITSLASSWRGDDNPSGVRARVYELLDLIAARLVLDKTLGRLVASATLIDSGYVSAFDGGSTATVRFVIRVQAWKR